MLSFEIMVILDWTSPLKFPRLKLPGAVKEKINSIILFQEMKHFHFVKENHSEIMFKPHQNLDS